MNCTNFAADALWSAEETAGTVRIGAAGGRIRERQLAVGTSKRVIGGATTIHRAFVANRTVVTARLRVRQRTEAVGAHA